MTLRPVSFEDSHTDTVTAVVMPIDGVTRRPVRRGVRVQLWDPTSQTARLGRLVTNLSGHIVLINEPADEDLTFRIQPGEAGYRGPLFVTFNPHRDGITRVVPLERRPESQFDEATTLVRGAVVRTAGASAPVPVPALTVTATGPGLSPRQCPATTDERGVFALPVAVKVAGADEGQWSTKARLRFNKDGLPARELEVDLEQGQTHIFTRPIDLDADDQPSLSHVGNP